MPRIPEEKIADLKSQTDIVALVRSYGVTLERSGKDYVGRCPFHHDKTPSLVVSPRKNLWHCMGACSVGGSVIDWVMRKESVSFRQAVEILAPHTQLGVSVAAPVQDTRTALVAGTTSDPYMLQQVVRYYHETLLQSDEAQAYLSKRGINDPELTKTFQLGYANRTLGLHLPKGTGKEAREVRQQLQQLGILRQSGHEHLAGSLVIPILYPDDNTVTQMYGRKLLDNLRPGTPKHLYLPGAQTGLFNYEGVQESEDIILCESLIDALTFWAAGMHNVTCSYGVNGLSLELQALLQSPQIKRLYIAYDRDEAGDKAAERIISSLAAARSELEILRVEFPPGMDANSFACSSRDATGALAESVRKARWLHGVAMPQQDNEGVSHTVPMIQQRIAEEVPAQIEDDELRVTFGDRHWRVRGFERLLSIDSIKINIRLSYLKDEQLLFYQDYFDLCLAKARTHFVQAAAQETNLDAKTIKQDLGQILFKLEAVIEERLKKENSTAKTYEMTVSERTEALQLLRSPDLISQIMTAFESCGVVGEQSNKLVAYLAATSRLLTRPLAVIVQSSSSAGKSSLMDAVLRFMPDEALHKYSALTGQSLFYMGDVDLKHKILAVVEEAGAEKASYALKLLQSEGELSIASTGKDPQSGRLITQEYRVEGPVMIFLTTTASDLDDELQNRCMVLGVSESSTQTKRIHEAQRKAQTLEGIMAHKEQITLIQLHKNVQRLLRPLAVVNPFAQSLTFVSHRTRSRRDHQKYLSLIQTIALLHQYQRPIKKQTMTDGSELEYIEVSREDIEKANELAADMLGKSMDELPPQTRRVLQIIDQMHTELFKEQEEQESGNCHRFSRRQLRIYSGLGDTRLKLHLNRLVDLEYLQLHRDTEYGRYDYSLLYDSIEDEYCVPELVDVSTL